MIPNDKILHLCHGTDNILVTKLLKVKEIKKKILNSS